MEKTEAAAFEIHSSVWLGVQRAARAVARRFDRTLKSTGITSGQFSILSSLLRDEAVSIGALADLLGLDRTSLARNLRPLEAKNFITTVPSPKDGRYRRIALTSRGRKKLDETIPLWRNMLAESDARLGKGRWYDLRPFLERLS